MTLQEFLLLGMVACAFLVVVGYMTADRILRYLAKRAETKKSSV